MKRIVFLILSMLLVLTGCGGTTMENTYQQITQEEAKKMMDTQEVVVLDVREQDEFDTRHIPGAVLLPVGTITRDTAGALIPKLDSVVWCTAATETAAKRRPRPLRTWAIPMFMSLAASIPGPTKWSNL